MKDCVSCLIFIWFLLCIQSQDGLKWHAVLSGTPVPRVYSSMASSSHTKVKSLREQTNVLTRIFAESSLEDVSALNSMPVLSPQRKRPDHIMSENDGDNGHRQVTAGVDGASGVSPPGDNTVDTRSHAPRGNGRRSRSPSVNKHGSHVRRHSRGRSRSGSVDSQARHGHGHRHKRRRKESESSYDSDFAEFAAFERFKRLKRRRMDDDEFLHEDDDDLEIPESQQGSPKPKPKPKNPAKPKKPTKPGRKGRDDTESEEERKEDPFEGVKDGAFSGLAKEFLLKTDDSPRSSAVNKCLASVVDNMIEKNIDEKEAVELALKYPSPENVTRMVVPKLEVSMKQRKDVEQHLKTGDVHVQITQEILLAGLTALMPACELILSRGAEGDSELNDAGVKVFDGLKLITYANNNLVRRRREALRHKLFKDVADTVISAPLGGAFLFGAKSKDNFVERKQEKRFFQEVMGPDKNDPKVTAKAQKQQKSQNKSHRGGRFDGSRGGYNPNYNSYNNNNYNSGGYNNYARAGFRKTQPYPPGTKAPYENYDPYKGGNSRGKSDYKRGGHRGKN